MKFQFKKQQYQWDAVESTVQVFNGQPNQSPEEYIFDRGKYYIKSNGALIEDNRILHTDLDLGYSNQPIALSDNDLLENLRRIQKENNINEFKIEPKKKRDAGKNESIQSSGEKCPFELDIEMETGTGKTYVYIKTMFELNKRYGWSKFIVVVPSVAIREGVKKSFDITQDHFMQEYGKKARYFVYDSKNLSAIDTFSTSSEISVMIINMQAFNTSFNEEKNVEGRKGDAAARIIFDKRDDFGSRCPIEVIAKNNPIIIRDEPQKMGGDATQRALKQFNPLFILNYSATHKEVHNPVYRLDALDAYNKKLVKKIEVIGFELKNITGVNRYLFLEDIILSKNQAPQARIEYECNLNGVIRRQTANFCEHDSLYVQSNQLQEYQGCSIQEIRPLESKVVLSDGTELHIGEAIGNVTAGYKARIQIRETIKAHLRKEQLNYHKGIKTLSLFFLDEVENYRIYDGQGNQRLGTYGQIFEEEYQNICNEFLKNIDDPDYVSYLTGNTSRITPKSTHAGYFSIDKKGHAVDSERKGKEQISDDISAYDLILKNKERLLSFEEPVRFIFSHSALREGWDNPNIFQICSLRQSNSAMQKRQEVGRGLRLCVDKNGIRQDAQTLGADRVHDINILTVIASEGYADFVDGLQKEISASLYSRPMKISPNLFGNIVIDIMLPNGQTQQHQITKTEAYSIFGELCTLGYIDSNGNVQDKFQTDRDSSTLSILSGNLAPLTTDVYKIVENINNPKVLAGMITNGHKTMVTNRLNSNFYKTEWKNLWDTICYKYAYIVHFNSQQLINQSIIAIDNRLNVSRPTYTKTQGVQVAGDDFEVTKTKQNTISLGAIGSVKYDLLGKIAQGTTLTRRTVANILMGIQHQKFLMYQDNPEDFITQCIRLICEQKATVIVNHITYNRLTDKYDSAIFTEEKHNLQAANAFQGKKSVLDYVFTDGYAVKGTSIERKFAQDLEHAAEVVVYAKLPKGFYIPTPVGNYALDWAIAFEEGSVKHVYFVAETKGSLSTLQLRPIEQTKIDCARKAFDLLSNSKVKYDCVDSYATLFNLAK